MVKQTPWKMDKRARKAKREGVSHQEYDATVWVHIGPGVSEEHRVILAGTFHGEPVYQCLDCDGSCS